MAWRLRGLGGAIPITLRIDSPVQRVGQKGRYLIIGAPPNAEIFWSSYKDGVATGELNASYGHKTEANGTASIEMGAPWAEEQQGAWIKEILIKDEQGQIYTAMTTFNVYPAISTSTQPATSAASGGGIFSTTFDLGGTAVPVWLPVAAIAAIALMRR